MEQKLSNRRRYLTADELAKLIKASSKSRHGRRDATLMLLMARHGLRVTEAVDLRWDQIDFPKGHLHVRRLKGVRAFFCPGRTRPLAMTQRRPWIRFALPAMVEAGTASDSPAGSLSRMRC